MKKQFFIAIKFLMVITIITGIVYPVFVTVIAQTAFKDKANGSLITKNGKIIGSQLIGQNFNTSRYFWPRPSSCDYNPLQSAGSNLGPTSKKLKVQVEKRRASFIKENGIKDSIRIPSEMLFASGSGLDPDISPEAAILQVNRIEKARNFNEAQCHQLISIIHKITEKPQFFMFGEEKINVFRLNLELDNIRQ
ncbi:MAG: potassium-transporting ATPase subunit KdpC [Bacteroidota bacterium]|nr:potassium-transporting ATPase subunit KdpC [Bacteroidota bacterium]MDP4273274.1 potassium-transporting ATPase subunit KdpC [Bacteroidota bacterium]